MTVPYLIRVSETVRSSTSADEPTLDDPLPWPATAAAGQELDTMITEVRQEATDDA